MVEQFKIILTEIEKEIASENSIWDKEQLVHVVKPEMEKLYAYFADGKVFFKYGKKQRMLESTYINRFYKQFDEYWFGKRNY